MWSLFIALVSEQSINLACHTRTGENVEEKIRSKTSSMGVKENVVSGNGVPACCYTAKAVSTAGVDEQH